MCHVWNKINNTFCSTCVCTNKQRNIKSIENEKASFFNTESVKLNKPSVYWYNAQLQPSIIKISILYNICLFYKQYMFSLSMIFIVRYLVKLTLCFRKVVDLIRFIICLLKQNHWLQYETSIATPFSYSRTLLYTIYKI